MAFNSFGNLLKLTTYGESHGTAIGGVIDGFPAGLVVDFDAIQEELNRSFKVSRTNTITSSEFTDSATTRASRALGFDSSGDFQNPLLPISLATVEEITIFDGIDNEVTTNYEYKDGIYYYDDDYTLNQYAGFGVVNAQTGDQIVKTYYHQGGGVDGYELGEYEDTIYKKGRVYREEVLEEDGANLYIISSKVNKWLDDDLEDGRHFVSLDNSVKIKKKLVEIFSKTNIKK